MYLLEFCCPLLCLLITNAGITIIHHYHGKLKIPKLTSYFWVILAMFFGGLFSTYTGLMESVTGDDLWSLKVVLIVLFINLVGVNLAIVLSSRSLFKKPILIAVQLIMIFIASPVMWVIFEGSSIMLLVFIQSILVMISGILDK